MMSLELGITIKFAVQECLQQSWEFAKVKQEAQRVAIAVVDSIEVESEKGSTHLMIDGFITKVRVSRDMVAFHLTLSLCKPDFNYFHCDFMTYWRLIKFLNDLLGLQLLLIIKWE